MRLQSHFQRALLFGASPAGRVPSSSLLWLFGTWCIAEPFHHACPVSWHPLHQRPCFLLIPPPRIMPLAEPPVRIMAPAGAPV